MTVAKPIDLTEELVALVERMEPDSGADDGLTPMSDADFEEAAQALLAEKGAEPFWVFAYGSLIWKPEFDHLEARRATAYGWRRDFLLDIVRWRATPEEPGLMLALGRGGACHGVAYRLAPQDQRAQMLRLLWREVAYLEDLAWVRWITCRAGDDSFRALVFYAEPRYDPAGYAKYLPIAEQARRLARAAGHLGSGAAYLRNTLVGLEKVGIHDSYLWRLQKLVAEEIRAMSAPTGSDKAEGQQ